MVSYEYNYEDIIPFKTVEPGSTFELICTKENNMCSNFEKISKLDQCSKFLIKSNTFSKDGLVELSIEEEKNLSNKGKLDMWVYQMKPRGVYQSFLKSLK